MTEASRKVEGLSTSDISRWIVGALAAIVMAGGSFWLTFVAAQVDGLREEQKQEQRDSSQVRERLKGVETKLEAVDATTKQTAEDVRRIRDSLEGRRSTTADSSR
jgi:type VI protein secretion system component VasK